MHRYSENSRAAIDSSYDHRTQKHRNFTKAHRAHTVQLHSIAIVDQKYIEEKPHGRS